jgi:phospholipid/cholesterol/gamma-HCH transport system permease protein
MTPTVPSRLHPRLRRTAKSIVSEWNRIGSQAQFYGKTLMSIPDAVVNYRTELWRLIAQMGLGAGALAVVGGTVAIVGFLTITTGALVAVQGYNQLASVGFEALTGFASAFFNRVLAGIVVVIPLYCVAVMMAFLAARTGTTAIYGQGSGVYDHYFGTFLNPTDLIWSFFQVVAIAVVIMLVHTYYGYNASGGPAGVGEAVGRAVRTSMVIAAVEIAFISLAVYGQSGNFNLAG